MFTIKDMPFFKYREMILEEITFSNDNIYRTYEQLIPFYDIVSGEA